MGAWVHGYMGTWVYMYMWGFHWYIVTDMGIRTWVHAAGTCRRGAGAPRVRQLDEISRRDEEMVTCLPPVKLHRRFNGVAQWVRAGGAADGAQLSLGRGLYVAAYEGLPPRPDGRAACTLDHQECARPFNPADSQEEQVVLGRALGRGRLLAPLLAQPQARAGALHHGPQVHARSRGPAHRTCSRSHALSTTRATATCACSAATAASLGGGP